MSYEYSHYFSQRQPQPVQWPREMNDEELALVYYNYRYYNPTDGRCINRDPVLKRGWNLYGFVKNNLNIDNLGLLSNDGSGIVIPNTETEGNCIGIACGTTKPLSPDPEKIPKNVDLNIFLDVIREVLMGDCTRMEKKQYTKWDSMPGMWKRNHLLSILFSRSRANWNWSSLRRTYNSISNFKKIPPFESKLGVDGNRVTGITNQGSKLYDQVYY